MKRFTLALLLMVAGAFPLFGQTAEFGVLVGGSSRFVEDAVSDVDLADSSFSFSNSTVDLYWAMPVEPELYFKIKGGRIETDVAYVAGQLDGEDIRRDARGEVQHLEGVIEYRFSEPFGSSGLFAGVGVYRHSSDESDATTAWGMNAGVNADFPITRRYGVVVEGTYHWTQADFRPRYLTVAGGMRISF